MTVTEEDALTQRIAELLDEWHKAGRAAFEERYPILDYDTHARKSMVVRRKYILLDEGNSGAFAVDKTTGKVYRIKAYGRPNLRKCVGHVDAINGLWLVTYRWW